MHLLLVAFVYFSGSMSFDVRIDLLGNGYTDRLVPGSPQAKNLSGETARNLTEVETELLLEKGAGIQGRWVGIVAMPFAPFVASCS